MGERYTYTEDGMIPTPQGQWVRAYDYDFVRVSQIEMIDTLQARVRELESLVETMEYKLEWYGEKEQQPQSLKGGA